MTRNRQHKKTSKVRVTVWIDRIGRTSATTRTREIDKINKRMQGFQELTSFNIPARYEGTWLKAYRYFVGWAIENLGK